MSLTKSSRFILCFLLVGLLSACAGTKKNIASIEPLFVEIDGEITVTEKPVEGLKRRAQAEQDYIMALGVMRNGKPKHALRLLTAFVKAYPHYSGPYANLGIIYQDADDFEKAEASYLKAAELKPDSAVIYNRLGMLYREMGQFEKAEKAYLNALEIDSGYAEAHMNLGILYDMYMHSPKKALLYYTRYQSLVDGRDEQVSIWIADLERRGHYMSKADLK
ncbi:tetratricopeptide repeat protein [Pseudomonadota bacterium]